MNMIKHIGRRYALAPVLFLGMVVNAMPVLADAGMEATASQASARAGVPVQEGAPVQGAVSAQADAPKEGAVGKVYMLVNGKPITVREYNQRLTYTLKNKYYHGRVPEGKEEETRKELTAEMVDHILLLEDAEKRGFKPDEAKIEKAIASEEWKNRNKPEWQRDRERLVAQLRLLVGQKSQLDQLEAAVKDVQKPTPAEVQAYYDQHLELFTEPEKLRLSVILLKVDPGSPDDAWRKAYNDAQKIGDQIKGGADFAEMARKYSGDKSAKNGGDMGYLHRGMVPAAIQDGVGKFKVGEISAPYKGLEGMSIFRLEDRIAPAKMEFQQVEQRAAALFLREKRDQVWKANLERLRGAAKIEVVTEAVTLPATQPSGGGK